MNHVTKTHCTLVPTHFSLAYVGLITLVAAMGGLLFGYDWVVIGGAKPFFERYFQIVTKEMVGWANSCALLGCLIGALAAGTMTERFGRKKLLLMSALLFGVSSICTGWAFSFNCFVFWRIIGGTAIGAASTLSPLYIAEISPAQWRGRLVSLNQFTIVLGILAAQIVNLLIVQPVPTEASAEMIRQSWNGQFAWRWMFTAVTVPSVIFFIGSLFVPESPRWLMKQGKIAQARTILSRIGGREYAETEIREIQLGLHMPDGKGRSPREWLKPGILRVLFIGCLLAVLQQWSGINILFNYAEEIYRDAGYGISDVMFNIVITGLVNLAFTLVALKTVDRFGRRFLMLVGCAGIGLSHFFVGLAYHGHWEGSLVLGFSLAAIGCYAMSLAPITWVLISEIFPNRIRGVAMAIAVGVLWIACFIMTYLFPILNRLIGPANTFWLFAAICVGGFLFVWFWVPETKNRSLEEIERDLC